MDSDSTTRRTYLRRVGAAAGAVAVAGCSGDSGTGTTDSEPTETTADDGMDTETPTPAEDIDPVTVVQGAFPDTLDPHNHGATTTSNVMLAAYGQVLFRDANGAIYGELATDWTRVESGRARLTIRDGVQFHSGSELTPEDVVFSLNRILVDDVGGLVSSQSSGFEPIQEAEPVDGEFAVDIISDGFNPVVFQTLAGQNGQILEKSWVQERESSEVAQEMNGTGPFRLTDFQDGQYVRFERFEDYWDGPADIPELEYTGAKESSVRVNQLVAGEADLVVNVPPQDVSRVQNADNARIDPVAALRMPFLAMINVTEPFDSQEFRVAMNLAVDNESIVDNVLQGFGRTANQPSQEGVFGYNPDIENYPQDQARAESLVNESGYAGVEIELHTPVGRYLKDVEVAQAAASQINELSNVTCSVEQRDFNALAGELVDGDITTGPDFYLIGFANAISDASYVIGPLLTSNGALTSWKNEETDALYGEAQSEPDQDRREELLQQLNQRFHDLAPWVFLHQQQNIYGASERLEWTPRGDDHIDVYSFSV